MHSHGLVGALDNAAPLKKMRAKPANTSATTYWSLEENRFMNTLFILSKSPFMHAETASTLKLVSKGDAVLLIHDAVVGLKDAPQNFRQTLESLVGKEVHLYALEEDCEARGIGSDIPKVTYDGFVDLITRFDRVVH